MIHNIEKKIIEKFEQLDKSQIKEHYLRSCSKRFLYEKLLNTIEFSIFAVDLEQKLIFVNHAAGRLFRLDPDELPGMIVSQCDCDELLKKKVREVVSKRDRLSQEELTVTVPVVSVLHLNSFDIIEEGRLEGFLFAAYDITEMMDRQLKEHHKESIHSLSTLTAGVAHEIKNPLGSLDLHMQLVDRFLDKNHFKGKGELIDLLKVIKDEIVRLDNVLNDFLFSARPIKPSLKKAYLNDVVRDAAAVLKPVIEKEGIELKINLDDDLDYLKLDSAYIKQAFLNVIKNAVHACENHEKPVIELMTFQEKEKQIFLIRDNGNGMTQEEMNKIFEPFYSTRDVGTGLGLTITYKIIHEHNGEIVLSSERGRGTEFRLEFLISANMKLLEA